LRHLAPFLMVLLMACASEPQVAEGRSPGGLILLAAAQSSMRSDADPSAGSPYGSYLAGLHAGRARDLSAAADFMLHALSYDPENLQLLNRSLLLLTGDGRYENAADIAQRIEALDPSNGLATLVLAVEAVKRGDIAEAEARLAAMNKQGLSGIAAPVLQGWIRVLQDDSAGALAKVTPLRNKSGFGVFYSLHAALMSDALGNASQARSEFELALEAAGQPSLRLVWLAGNFYERQGDSARAIELYETFLATSPDSNIIGAALSRARMGGQAAPVLNDAIQGIAEALFNLASLLSQEGAEDIGLVHVHLALRLNSNFTIAKVLLGEILQGQDRGAEAIAAYRDIPSGSAFSWIAGLRIAEELERLERIDDAAAELEALATAEPERAESLIRLGNLLRNRERFAESVSAYDRAVERVGEPTQRYWSLYYFRGIALERISEWTRAERDFLTALELEPEQPFVMNYLAYSWIEKKLNFDKAKRMLVRAVELRPNDGFIVDSLGWVYFRLGEYDLGVKYLERAVELRPQDPVINDHLGDAYWRVGRKQEARFQWRRSLSLEPEAEEISKIESKIDTGLSDQPKDI